MDFTVAWRGIAQNQWPVMRWTQSYLPFTTCFFEAGLRSDNFRVGLADNRQPRRDLWAHDFLWASGRNFTASIAVYEVTFHRNRTTSSSPRTEPDGRPSSASADRGDQVEVCDRSPVVEGTCLSKSRELHLTTRIRHLLERSLSAHGAMRLCRLLEVSFRNHSAFASVRIHLANAETCDDEAFASGTTRE